MAPFPAAANIMNLPYSSGQTNQGGGVQGEDGASQELLKRAYDQLEKWRAEYDKNCRGSAAGSAYCKSLAKKIEELEESIDGFIRPKDGGKGNGSESPSSSGHGGPGGVDFRNLEPIYVKAGRERQGGLSVVYSVPFQDGPFDASKVSGSVQLSEKSFLVGFSIPEEKFWVNLNPTEADRIADPGFGRTESARVLLVGDLSMKKDAALMTDPRSSVEARDYWQRLRVAAGLTGETGEFQENTRFWIVPGQIELAGSADEAYLKKADLKVELESEYLGSRGAVESGSPESRNALRRSEAIEKEFVLPKLQELVNTALEYQELRQVYASLILGVWRRQQVAAAADIGIAVDPASLLSRPGWTPRATWLDYRRSMEKGEYDFTEETRETRGDLIITRTVRYFNGGVDFTHISIPPLSPIDDNTRGILQRVASDGKPVRLGSRVLFADSQSQGAWLPGGGTTQPSEATSIWSGWFEVFLVAGILVAVAIFLVLLTRQGVS